MVICLERGADLHMFQLMPLPLTVSCFSKIQIGFAFLVLAHLGSPGKRAIGVCVCRVNKLLSLHATLRAKLHMPLLTVSNFTQQIIITIRSPHFISLFQACFPLVFFFFLYRKRESLQMSSMLFRFALPRLGQLSLASSPCR